jgi:hypothetical protein
MQNCGGHLLPLVRGGQGALAGPNRGDPATGMRVGNPKVLAEVACSFGAPRQQNERRRPVKLDSGGGAGLCAGGG